MEKKDKTLEQLIQKTSSIEGISSKKMFGGYGIFHESKMFGLIDSTGNPYFKVNETNQTDYEERNSIKHSKMPYFTIPQEILKDEDLLIIWTKKSISISK